MNTVSYENYYWQNDLVRLRALKVEDWESAYPAYFDSRARFLLQEEIELPPVATQIQSEYQKYAGFNPESGRIMFTIENTAGEPVGGLNLNNLNERHGTFSAGIQILPGFRSRGYGTAAMRLALKYAFLERRLHKFNSGCLEGNHESIAMHRKLGCMQEGVRRQMYYSQGRFFDGILFGLTVVEFIANQKKPAEG